MAKVDTQQLALNALSRAVLDPAPKPLHGSAAKPGIFDSAAAAAKKAAQLCLDNRWLEATGEFAGSGKSRKELYRITAAGAQQALDNSEPVQLLRDCLANLDKILALRERIESTLQSVSKQRDIVEKGLSRLQPPDLSKLLGGPSASAPAAISASEWQSAALAYIADYQRRHPTAHCPLPELFEQVAAPHRLSIGQFHDGLRQLVKEGQLRLHPFTEAPYRLEKEEYALVAGQGIKYYAERIAST